MLDVIRQVAIAWKNLNAYTWGHPATGASIQQAHRRLHELIAAGGELTLGIGRDAIVAGPETLTSTHARDLARILYLRGVAVITFAPGLTPDEFRSFVEALGPEAGAAERPPLREQLAAAGVAHVAVESVDYSNVRVTDDVGGTSSPPAMLWEALLRALLAGHALSVEGQRLVDRGDLSAAVIATLMGEIADGGGGDGVGGGTGAGEGPGSGHAVPGAAQPEGRAAAGGGGSGGAGRGAVGLAAVSTAVRTHLRRLEAEERLLAANQVAELVRALPLAFREEVVAAAAAALAADDGGAAALDVIAGAVAPDTMLQGLRRVAREMPLSPHALRLMTALAKSERPAPGSLDHPDPVLLDELRGLFRAEDVDRFNPSEHQERLAAVVAVPHVDTELRADLGESVGELGDEEVLSRLAGVCIEMLGSRGATAGFEGALGRVEGAFEALVKTGLVESATRIAEELRDLAVDETTPDALRGELAAAMARMGQPQILAGALEALHQRGREATTLARRLIDALGTGAARAFLLALVEEEDKSHRRRLLDLLVSIGPPIVPHVAGLLDDPRWYVVRNMVVLLHRVGDRTSIAEIRRCTTHADLRVRLEAIKCLVSVDPALSADLLEKAIKDPDPKLAETAVGLAGSYGIAQAVAPLVDVVDCYDLLARRRSLRVRALKALGELGQPDALPRLARYFRNWPVPVVALEERRTAFRALQGYAPDARAPYVELGLRSRDAQIRETCARLHADRSVAAPRPEGDA